MMALSRVLLLDMELNGKVVSDVNVPIFTHPVTQRPYMRLKMPLSEQEAIFFVSLLNDVLAKTMEHSPQLSLFGDSEEGEEEPTAVTVLSNFLQRTTTLFALNLHGFTPPTFRRLLNALHTNTSIKELEINNLWHAEGWAWTAELLRHKNDFTYICFGYITSFRISHLLPFMRQWHATLQKFEIKWCKVDDEGARLLVEELLNSVNKYKSLKEISLFCNGITSSGLISISRLFAAGLPGFQTLNLDANDTLLDNKASTLVFVQHALLSPGTRLKELRLPYCSRQAEGYGVIIKALETNTTLKRLDIMNYAVSRHAIREQFIQSLPRMTGLQELATEHKCFDLNDQRTMTAFRANVSLVAVRHYFPHGFLLSRDPRLIAILERNKHLMKLDCLLGTPSTMPPMTNAPTPTIPPPCGLWAPVLAKVGKRSEGSSHVFKILCNRLATWISETRMVSYQ